MSSKKIQGRARGLTDTQKQRIKNFGIYWWPAVCDPCWKRRCDRL